MDQGKKSQESIEMTFWTCGPFKEVQDRADQFAFRMIQSEKFMNILKELEDIEKLENSTPDEKMLAALMKLDVELKLNKILGVPDESREEEDDEVSRKAILESLTRI
jgi:hypothetical protein